METFGLMQLLNTLLPKAAVEEKKTEETERENPPSVEVEKGAEKPNACAQFFERHDHRAKNLPKR